MVKAFNYAFAPRMADPAVDGIRLDGFVAGDDQAAKDKVLELVGSIGSVPSTPAHWSWPECSSPWPF